jgi:hypothetical protein
MSTAAKYLYHRRRRRRAAVTLIVTGRAVIQTPVLRATARSTLRTLDAAAGSKCPGSAALGKWTHPGARREARRAWPCPRPAPPLCFRAFPLPNAASAR